VAEKTIKDLIKKSKIIDQEEEEKKGQEAAL
jgi:hypothetical protein